MIVTLSGITGVGKSFFKNEIIDKLNFKNLIIVTTRKKRENEIEGIDKHFVTQKEFFELKNKGEIVADFEFLGEYYAYIKQDIERKVNQVTELHYEAIENFKKNIKEELFAIYMIPNDIERAKKELKNRNLSKEVEEKRLKEIINQKNIFESDEQIRNKFDYIFENNYDEESEIKLLEVLKSILEKKGEEIYA
ncbi:MAG: hypothetical protein IJV31_11570 [Clostridia bacterium]|nr:hypothetical protein [Clostridia bacterium]